MKKNRIIPYRADLKAKARELRKNSTLAEILLWREIKEEQLMGFQFHRQVPMLEYIVDFYCHELQLAIEINGVVMITILIMTQIGKQKSKSMGLVFCDLMIGRRKGIYRM